MWVRFLLPMTTEEFVFNLLDEVRLNISDPCILARTFERREVFNSFYDIEIREIYNDTKLTNKMRRVFDKNCKSVCRSNFCLKIDIHDGL